MKIHHVTVKNRLQLSFVLSNKEIKVVIIRGANDFAASDF